MKMYKLIIFFLLCLFCVGISFATSNNENSSINEDVGQNHNLNKILVLPLASPYNSPG